MTCDIRMQCFMYVVAIVNETSFQPAIVLKKKYLPRHLSTQKSVLHNANLIHSSAKSQRDILRRSASLDLAATRRRPVRPRDSRARRLRALDLQLLPGKGITKDTAQVVPDLGAVEAVGEVGLGRAAVEAVAGAGDLERLAARLGVLDEGLGVGAALGLEVDGVGDGGADGPERHFGVAVVDDAGAADGGDEGGGDGQHGEEGVELHGGDSGCLVGGKWIVDVGCGEETVVDVVSSDSDASSDGGLVLLYPIPATLSIRRSMNTRNLTSSRSLVIWY